MTRPAEHLVDDGLDEEDEEEAKAEEELGEGILQLQHGRRHHAQPRSSLEGLPHLVKEEFDRKYFLCLFYLAQHVDEHGGDENATTET